MPLQASPFLAAVSCTKVFTCLVKFPDFLVKAPRTSCERGRYFSLVGARIVPQRLEGDWSLELVAAKTTDSTGESVSDYPLRPAGACRDPWLPPPVLRFLGSGLRIVRGAELVQLYCNAVATFSSPGGQSRLAGRTHTRPRAVSSRTQ